MTVCIVLKGGECTCKACDSCGESAQEHLETPLVKTHPKSFEEIVPAQETEGERPMGGEAYSPCKPLTVGR